jgi:transcriptional regulator with XRE-family HTH domain
MDKELIELIKLKRIEKGMSQARLAELISVHRNTIGSFEAGRGNITLDNVQKICKVLNIKITFTEDK